MKRIYKNRETEEQRNRRTAASGEPRQRREKLKPFLCFYVSMFTGARQGRGGFIALITVIIVSAITLIVAATTIFLGTSESLLGFSADQSHETFQIGESCMEEALFRLKQEQVYAGETIFLGNGSCVITITGTGGKNSTRVIVASSTVSTPLASFTRRITASTTQISNADDNATTTDLTRWRE